MCLALIAACGGGGGVAQVQGDSQDATPASDGDGNCLTLLAQSVTTDAAGNVTTIVDFAYDIHGNLIRIEEFDLATATTRRVTYFVDPTLTEEDDGADGLVDLLLRPLQVFLGARVRRVDFEDGQPLRRECVPTPKALGAGGLFQRGAACLAIASATAGPG